MVFKGMDYKEIVRSVINYEMDLQVGDREFNLIYNKFMETDSIAGLLSEYLRDIVLKIVE